MVAHQPHVAHVLIDYGLAANRMPGKKLKVHCGSPSYALPEIERFRPDENMLVHYRLYTEMSEWRVLCWMLASSSSS